MYPINFFKIPPPFLSVYFGKRSHTFALSLLLKGVSYLATSFKSTNQLHDSQQFLEPRIMKGNDVCKEDPRARKPEILVLCFTRNHTSRLVIKLRSEPARTSTSSLKGCMREACSRAEKRRFSYTALVLRDTFRGSVFPVFRQEL